jgi:hypothetical protein
MAAKKKRAKKGRAAKKTSGRSSGTSTKPVFPYATRPSALRKFLDEVPKRPKPQKVNAELLASWGMGGGENTSIIRVLKALSLIGNSNEPTDQYVAYMRAGAGPAVLGSLLKQVYAPLFGSSLEPHRESNEALRNLFNIHSGGAESTIEFQIQTFKALCDYARFDGAPGSGVPASAPQGGGSSVGAPGAVGTVPVNINLHIHLPEQKTSREYEYIIQDIARYIYGRDPGTTGDRDRQS